MKLQNQTNCAKNRERPQSAISIPLFSILLMSTAFFSSCVTVQSSSQEPYYVTEYTTENKTEIYTETVPVTRAISHEQLIQPYILWSNPQLVFNKLKSIWYYGYDLSSYPSHEKQKIKITFFRQQFYEFLSVSVFDMDPRGQILAPPLIAASDNITPAPTQTIWITSKEDIGTYATWFNAANVKLNFAHFIGGKINLFVNSSTTDPVELDTHGAKDVAVLIYGPTDPQNCRFNTTLVWTESITENITRTAERSVPVQIEHRVLKNNATVQPRQVPFWDTFTTVKP
jgi:hypothetical protein